MGLLGEVSDDSDDDDDDAPPARAPASAAPKGKNQALFEALNGQTSSSGKSAPTTQSREPPTARRQDSDPFQDRTGPPPQGRDDGRRPAQLMIPPVAASTNAQPARSPQFPPSPQQIQQQQLSAPPQINRTPSPSAPQDIPSRLAAGSPMPAPRPQRPAPAFMIAPPGSPAPLSPAPPYSPGPNSPMLPTTPLQLPPSTPITPLFAAPPPNTKSENEKSAPQVTFNPDVLLERTREKSGGSDDSHSSDGSRANLRKPRNDGDEFWRRFSMVAHQAETDARKRSNVSSWLSKTEAHARSYSRWVALSGILILCLIAGGVAAGIYFNEGKGNGHAAPVAIGGKEEQSAIESTSAAAANTAAGAAKTTRTGLAPHTLTTENGSVMPLPTEPAKRGNMIIVEAAAPTATPNLDYLAEKLTAPKAPLPRHHHHERDRRHQRNRIIA